MYKNHKADEGLSKSIFDRFDMVCSGHFHHRSETGNITYQTLRFRCVAIPNWIR